MIHKYRAWDSNNKKWIEHFYITQNGIIYNMEDNSELFHKPIPIEKSNLIVMQSINLFEKIKDLNPKEIFENDIIHAYSENGTSFTGIVTYIDNTFCLKNKNGNHNSLWTNAENYEIIGNIFDNPELLNPQNKE